MHNATGVHHPLQWWVFFSMIEVKILVLLLSPQLIVPLNWMLSCCRAPKEVFRWKLLSLYEGLYSQNHGTNFRKMGKKGHHHHWSGLLRFPLFLTNPQHHLGITSSRALVWAQAQLSSSIRSEDISRTMAPIWEKRAKKATTITDQVCHVSPSLWRIPCIIWL